MSRYVNVVHPDLPGQLGRISTAALPAHGVKGWAIAKDDDLGPDPKSKYVEAAKAALAEKQAEAAAKVDKGAAHKAELADLNKQIAAAVADAKPQPKAEEK